MVYEAFAAAERSPRLAWATTSNLSVRRADFLSFGGFDPAPWTQVGGEDVDLGLRLKAAGRWIASQPSAVVRHAAPVGVSGPARKLFVYGVADGWLCDRFPEHERVRANPPLIALGCLAASLVVRGRPFAAAVAAAALAGDIVVEVRRRSLVHTSVARRHLAAAAALDWAYDLGRCAAAVRQRRLRSALTEFRY